MLERGPTAGFVAVVQCSLMVWLGYLLGQWFGWGKLPSFYAGAAIAISSTTIIVKAFEEQGIKGHFTNVVFGILIVEDLIAILLITMLTALSLGKELTSSDVAIAAGRLGAFLTALVVIGLLTVPRLMRAVVKTDRSEMIVVASVGLAFGAAYLALYFNYSVALGAFIAGSLVAESGVEKKVEHLVQPVRDIFAAIFFVSVGMLINPETIVDNWGLVLVFFTAVVLGKVLSVTTSAFLTGQSVQTSVKTGMSLAQIGEFSFIIAGLGIATKATDELLYSVAVAVSGMTTLLTPWFIRAAPPAAAWVDRKLPRSMQTFVTLYSSWLEQLHTGGDTPRSRIRARLRWLLVDAFILGAVVIGASIEMERLVKIALRLGAPERFCRIAVVVTAAIVSLPFAAGMVRVAHELGMELGNRALPKKAEGIDTADAPRKLLIVTLQLAICVVVGIPLVAITQPFIPPLEGALILIALFSLLAISFWRNALNLHGHTRAATQAIAEALARRTRDGRESIQHNELEEANQIFTGIGSPITIALEPGSPALGKTLAEIDLRGMTGASVLAIRRRDGTIVVPTAQDRLFMGDVLAIAGSTEAVECVRHYLGLSLDSDPQEEASAV